jgi:hypothetical protein
MGTWPLCREIKLARTPVDCRRCAECGSRICDRFEIMHGIDWKLSFRGMLAACSKVGADLHEIGERDLKHVVFCLIAVNV